MVRRRKRTKRLAVAMVISVSAALGLQMPQFSDFEKPTEVELKREVRSIKNTVYGSEAALQARKRQLLIKAMRSTKNKERMAISDIQEIWRISTIEKILKQPELFDFGAFTGTEDELLQLAIQKELDIQ